MKKVFRFLLKLLYPPKCIFCKSPVQDEMFEICPECIEQLPFKDGNLCPVCSVPVPYIYGEMLCPRCRSGKRFFDKAVAPFLYKDEVRSALIAYKFHGKTFYAKTFAQFILKEIEKAPEGEQFDIITYVPLHPLRHISRGYNQSKMIAEYIAEKMGLPLTKTLVKIKNTRPLSLQKKKSRQEAVKGVYALKKSALENLKGKKILIIDDIITTGATLSECAHILKKGGAVKVFAAAAAQTPGE